MNAPSLIDALAPALLQASVACAAVSLPVWLLLEWAVRRWPAISVSRAVWAMSHLLIVAAFVLVLLPQSAQLSVLAPIEIARAAGAAQDAPLLVDAMLEATSDDADPAAGGAWIGALASAWLAIYCAGVLVAAGRVLLLRRALERIVAAAQRLGPADLEAHPGFDQFPAPGLPVYESDAAVSPMLIGCLRPRLLLPRTLRSFSEQQQQLIVAHELAHWRRRDPWLLHASIILQALFWFNPALRAFGERLHWAQELSCDRTVLNGSGQPERRAYAAALVAQLKLQQSAVVHATLAFGSAGFDSMGGRICLIREGGAPLGGRVFKALVLALLVALIVCGALLQPVFAWRLDAPPAAAATAAATVLEWRSPIEHPRVSSFYGAARTNSPAGHAGVDFAVKTGTPVLAAAAGLVVDSTDLFGAGEKYGKVIVIEHANGMRSTYAHLNQRLVQAGAAVNAGQRIGLSGATGKVSGPHLHLEMSDATGRIDPASLIAGLEARAYPSALRKRPPVSQR